MNFSLIGLAQVVGLIKYAEKSWFRPDMSWWEVAIPVMVIVGADFARHMVAYWVNAYKATQAERDVDAAIAGAKELVRIGQKKSLTESAFKSPDEIVADLEAKLDDASRAALKNIKFSNLIGLHFTAGRAIRNEYKLWDPLNPYIDASDVEGDRHPDQVSQKVIEELWRRLQ